MRPRDTGFVVFPLAMAAVRLDGVPLTLEPYEVRLLQN